MVGHEPVIQMKVEELQKPEAGQVDEVEWHAMQEALGQYMAHIEPKLPAAAHAALAAQTADAADAADAAGADPTEGPEPEEHEETNEPQRTEQQIKNLTEELEFQEDQAACLERLRDQAFEALRDGRPLGSLSEELRSDKERREEREFACPRCFCPFCLWGGDRSRGHRE